MQNLPWPLNSRKAISIIVAIIVIVVLLATGQMDGETAGTLITTLVIALIGTIAWEDTAEKQGASITRIEATTKDETATVTTTSGGAGG